MFDVALPAGMPEQIEFELNRYRILCLKRLSSGFSAYRNANERRDVCVSGIKTCVLCGKRGFKSKFHH